MDIKELGISGIIVIGGVTYGISQYGLEGALSEELSHISEVSRDDRPAYMDKIVGEFSEAFSSYIVANEDESYYYVGDSRFSTAPANGVFIEVVTPKEAVPRKEIKAIKSKMETGNFCAQDEMTMFTDNGWTYKFTMRDANGSKLFHIDCKPLQLRTS